MPLNFVGLDITSPLNRIRAGAVALCLNVRAYIKGGVMLRTLLSGPIVTLGAAVETIIRLNDTTPLGPPAGYSLISLSGTVLYVGSTEVASGFIGPQISMVTFRPNTSVQPWVYTGDSLDPAETDLYVTLDTKFAINGNATTFITNGMTKVRSDGLIYKAGIKEPQVAPVIGIKTTTTTDWLTLPADTPPWTNIGGANARYNYGGTDVQPPYPTIIGNLIYQATVKLIVTGTATVNGSSHGPGDSGPSSAGYPGQYVNSPMITIANGGQNYLVGDVLTVVQAGGSGGTITVTSVETVGATNGIINGFSFTTGGTGYSPAQNLSTTGGTGTLAKVNILSVNASGAILNGPTIVLYAFTDSDGNVIAPSSAATATPTVGSVGTSAVLSVPTGATQLQIGIDSQGGTFAANAGSYLIEAVVSTSAISPVTAIVGLVTAYIWGDSPHTSSSAAPIATYIWRNTNDQGTGIVRTIETAMASGNNNSLIFDSTPEDGTVPVQWTTLDVTGAATGSTDLFSPALESDGYQDFNCCITGNIFFPQGGSYAVSIQYKDQMLFGMGGGVGVIGSITQTGGGDGTNILFPPVFGTMNQSITVASALPLLDVGRINSTTAPSTFQTDTFNISVPSLGVYAYEFDWDYWDHTGRSLIIQIAPTPGAGVATIPPLPQGVRQNVEYAYKYRSSVTGAVSNPSPASDPQLTPVLANTVTSAYSPDPQVDKVDYYRQDTGLSNFTYVGTGPNDGLGGTINGVVMNTPIVDELSDAAAADNQLMDSDDFEPVPSIDTPKSGKVVVVAGVVTWKSGDQFNTRWLPGTIIEIGSPTQIAYTFVTRPTSATTVVIPDVPDTIGDAAGDGVQYNIAEPILANQPLPYLFGPTDNINFSYGVGDPLRPGTLYWSKGNNLDSWPDTNQQDVTDPSEALVNGAMSAGLGVLFSIRRAWLILPNFFNSEATSTGTSGSTWTLEATAITRGLYIPRCVAIEGGGRIFFRVEDGIHTSARGASSESITDIDLYPLFPHEGSTPQPVVRNGVTIYPPDDTQPQLQKFNIFAQFLYWDYVGTDGNPYTLVFDIDAKGWVPDKYNVGVTSHAANEGESVQGILVGCSDGTIRQMLSSGAIEPGSGIIVSPAIGGMGWMHCGQIDVEYNSRVTTTLTLVAVDTQNGSYGPPPITLPSTNGVVQKLKINPGPNKWKLAQFRFDFTDPKLQIFLEGFAAMCKPWGSSQTYGPIQPFAPNGGLGGQP